jgi:hypothetical protein
MPKQTIDQNNTHSLNDFDIRDLYGKRHSDKWDALANDTRFFVLTGGRGSGKSYEVGKFQPLSFQRSQDTIYEGKQ